MPEAVLEKQHNERTQQGEAGGRTMTRRNRNRCTLCGNAITATNRSLKPGVCLDCRFEKYRQEKPKQERKGPIRPVVVYGEGKDWQAPDPALFGGYDFGNANVCPLG